MNNLKELSELAWQGELDTKFEHHPVHTFYEGSTELQLANNADTPPFCVPK